VQKHVKVLSEKHLQLHAGIWQKEKFLERLPTPTVHLDVLQAHMHNQVAHCRHLFHQKEAADHPIVHMLLHTCKEVAHLLLVPASSIHRVWLLYPEPTHLPVDVCLTKHIMSTVAHKYQT
jgi:hypothetical protein